MPHLVIVAGPNGSGKTTLVRSGVIARALGQTFEAINADDIAKSLAGDQQPTDWQSLRAAQMADARLDAAIASGASVLIETVLSSDKFKPRVEAAKKAFFTFTLIYVTVRQAALNVARVDHRGRRGGHPVPPDRVIARRGRSHAMFAWFAREADTVLVFDNSDAVPHLVAFRGRDGWAQINPERLPADLARVIEQLSCEQPSHPPSD